MHRGGQRNPPQNYHRRKLEPNLNLSIGQLGRTRDQAESSRGSTAQPVHPSPQHNAQAVIDVDALEDKVVIDVDSLDDRAKNNATRLSRAYVVVDLDSEEHAGRSDNCVKRRRGDSVCRAANVQHVCDLETISNTKKDRCFKMLKAVSPPPPPPPEPAFSCPICMQQLDEEMTTKCGHIFCKKCIQTAISVKSVCPTCRKKINKKDVIRIYLPTTR